ncbi:MAG: DNA polymerase III subunit delta', partial [Aquificaceae bacterium]
EVKKITGITDDMILSLCEGSLTKAKRLLEKKELITMAETIINGDPLEVYSVSQRLESMEYKDQKLFLYILESFIYKSMFDEKESHEVYQDIIKKVREINEGIKRGAKISLAIFHIHILLGGESNVLYKG